MNTFRLKRNLDEAVYEQILSSIFEGKFHSGEQVQIERLCEQYEISRTPVIQALKRLATDGIVETSPTGKYIFPAADERRVRDMMEMRLFFEVGAANLICDIGEPAMDYRIAECEEECSRSQESGDSYRSSMADMKLHRMIVACARNSYMTELYNRVQNNCVTLNYLNLKGVAVVSQEAVDHHRMICDAPPPPRPRCPRQCHHHPCAVCGGADHPAISAKMSSQRRPVLCTAGLADDR